MRVNARWLLAAVLGPAICATLLGLVLLWPGGSGPELPSQFQYGSAKPAYVTGTVELINATSCLGPGSQGSCEDVGVRLDGHPRTAPLATISVIPGSGNPDFHIGDRVRLARVAVPGEQTVYYFDDYLRGPVLGWLALVFAVVVVVVARWRGLMALAGLGLAYLVLVLFLLPALIRGEPPVEVGLVGAAAILVLVLYIAHGPTARTSTALVGTLASLAVTGGLAAAAVAAAHLTGLSSDTTATLESEAGQVHYSGLILCGMIVGAIGVLNDVTVTQASAVWEIHGADPTAGAPRLYRAGMRVGRDHIASTVYTLVLAYAGAALPLLLLFDLGHAAFGQVVTQEVVAEEVVRTLVGSVGLVACVPLTTAIAAWVVTSGSRRLLQAEPDETAPPAE